MSGCPFSGKTGICPGFPPETNSSSPAPGKGRTRAPEIGGCPFFRPESQDEVLLHGSRGAGATFYTNEKFLKDTTSLTKLYAAVGKIEELATDVLKQRLGDFHQQDEDLGKVFPEVLYCHVSIKIALGLDFTQNWCNQHRLTLPSSLSKDITRRAQVDGYQENDLLNTAIFKDSGSSTEKLYKTDRDLVYSPPYTNTGGDIWFQIKLLNVGEYEDIDLLLDIILRLDAFLNQEQYKLDFQQPNQQELTKRSLVGQLHTTTDNAMYTLHNPMVRICSSRNDPTDPKVGGKILGCRAGENLNTILDNTSFLGSAVIGEEDPEYTGGSYGFIQSFRFNWQTIHSSPMSSLENAIGRKFDDEMIPNDDQTSHVRCSRVDGYDKSTVQLLRMSLPYDEIDFSDEGGVIWGADKKALRYKDPFPRNPEYTNYIKKMNQIDGNASYELANRGFHRRSEAGIYFVAYHRDLDGICRIIQSQMGRRATLYANEPIRDRLLSMFGADYGSFVFLPNVAFFTTPGDQTREQTKEEITEEDKIGREKLATHVASYNSLPRPYRKQAKLRALNPYLFYNHKDYLEYQSFNLAILNLLRYIRENKFFSDSRLSCSEFVEKLYRSVNHLKPHININAAHNADDDNSDHSDPQYLEARTQPPSHRILDAARRIFLRWQSGWYTNRRQRPLPHLNDVLVSPVVQSDIAVMNYLIGNIPLLNHLTPGVPARVQRDGAFFDLLTHVLPANNNTAVQRNMLDQALSPFIPVGFLPFQPTASLYEQSYPTTVQAPFQNPMKPDEASNTIFNFGDCEWTNTRKDSYAQHFPLGDRATFNRESNNGSIFSHISIRSGLAMAMDSIMNTHDSYAFKEERINEYGTRVYGSDMLPDNPNELIFGKMNNLGLGQGKILIDYRADHELRSNPSYASGTGHVVPDYSNVLKYGFGQVCHWIKQEIEAVVELYAEKNEIKIDKSKKKADTKLPDTKSAFAPEENVHDAPQLLNNNNGNGSNIVPGLVAPVDPVLLQKESSLLYDQYCNLVGSLIALTGLQVYCLRHAVWYISMINNVCPHQPQNNLQNPNLQSEKVKNLLSLSSRALSFGLGHPPVTFADACNMLFILHSSMHTTGEPTAVGRFDRYLYAFFAAEIDKLKKSLSIHEREALPPHLSKLKDNAVLKNWIQKPSPYEELLSDCQEIVDNFWLKLGEKVQLNRLNFMDEQPMGNMAFGGVGGAYPQGAAMNQWIQQLTIGGTDIYERLVDKKDDKKCPVNYCNKAKHLIFNGRDPHQNTFSTFERRYMIDLQLLALRATRRLPLNAPCLSVRVCPSTPDAILMEASKAIMSGGAHPIIWDDIRVINGFILAGNAQIDSNECDKKTLYTTTIGIDATIDQLHNKATDDICVDREKLNFDTLSLGSSTSSSPKNDPWDCTVPLTIAIDWACDGCYEPQLVGNNCFMLGGFPAPLAVERAINKGMSIASAGPTYINGKREGFDTPGPQSLPTYQLVEDLFLQHYRALYEPQIAGNLFPNHGNLSKICPSPLMNLFFRGYLAHHLDFYAGGPRYYLVSPQFTALMNAINSLFAIKKLCYDESITSLPYLVTALKCNWGMSPNEPFVGERGGEKRIQAEVEAFQKLRQNALKVAKFGSENLEVNHFGFDLMTKVGRTVQTIIKRIDDKILVANNQTILQNVPETIIPHGPSAQLVSDLGKYRENRLAMLVSGQKHSELYKTGILYSPGQGTFENYQDFAYGYDVGASADGRCRHDHLSGDFTPSPEPSDLKQYSSNDVELDQILRIFTSNYYIDTRNTLDPINRHNQRFYAGNSAALGRKVDRFGPELPQNLSKRYSIQTMTRGWEQWYDGVPADYVVPEATQPKKLFEKLSMIREGYGTSLSTFTAADHTTFDQAVLHPERFDLLRVRTGGWTEFFVAMFTHNQLHYPRRQIYPCGPERRKIFKSGNHPENSNTK